MIEHSISSETYCSAGDLYDAWADFTPERWRYPQLDTLKDLIGALGYGSVTDFLSSNPDAISAVVRSIISQMASRPEWKQRLTDAMEVDDDATAKETS
ncbi:hypothetical protein LCGC14_0235650 [marine sediment metagenome]|uniref:Uncharacterized protein n=1 Tax=marine sediment metagenome TaxID=412755 RepID=A0A0F9UDH3_9ZZZZ